MQKLKVGIVGLGRLGQRYAENLALRIPNAELIAACSIVSDERQWAKQELNVQHIYSQYDEMVRRPDLDLVFVLSSSSLHIEHMSKALDVGLHVFSEKPLATSTAACLDFEQHASNYPNQTAAVGFVRRFDKSYQYAKEKVDEGTIGRPFLVRSQTIDLSSKAEFQTKFVGSSGGIFHDFNVHDIDLARWFLGSEIASVHSIGEAYKFPIFGELGDADNVMSTCVFENGSMAVINASRTAAHGHDTYTEVIGTEGTLRIGRPASKNRVEIYDQHGARRECVETFWDRFEDAFFRMTTHVVDCVQQSHPLAFKLSDATQATRVAEAFTTSFKTGKLVNL
ncbi:MAG: Gfo/Idh/MocA family oxidoreductase [Saprospiraceae bacterium]|nr:Gfo/Idh/MocA family oxidoreductase [Saprospiraceae bacterium]